MSDHPKTTARGSQSARFIEAARAAGVSEDEAVFDANLKQIAKAKVSRDDVASTPAAKPKAKTD